MLKQLALMICLVTIMGLNSTAQDEPKVQQQARAFNTVCPVDGEAVTAEAPTIHYSGKVYGFDSPSCAAVFNEDPSLFTGNLNEDGTEFTGKKDIVPNE